MDGCKPLMMGRNEGDDLAASQIFYPVMQCADIFFLKADICQLGAGAYTRSLFSST